MFNFQLGVIATHLNGQNYDVLCNRCNEQLGSMAADTILQAVFNTLGRGGVLCPECRQETCDGCGKEEVDSVMNIQYDDRGVLRMCASCTAIVKRNSFAKEADTKLERFEDFHNTLADIKM